MQVIILTKMEVEILGEKYSIDINSLDLGSKYISKYISEFPNSIEKLVNLKYLSLCYNQLTSLPESIGKLTNLQMLNLYNNQITTLPESIGKLTNLKYLSLYNNQITILPTSILNIKESLCIFESGYSIDNLDLYSEILIFTDLDKELTNLPPNLKEIWIKKENLSFNHKLPFGCVIKYY